jgi:hypothetical protein
MQVVIRRRVVRRAGIVAAMVIAAGVVVGSVIAGRIEWSDNSVKLDAALAEAQPIQLAGIPAADGLPERGVFAQVTSTGHFCLSDAPIGTPLMGGGGCNSADDPLGGSPISASLAYDGGPTIASVKDARLIGLAAADVASVRVVMSDDTSRAIKLKKAKVGSDEFQAFGYRFKKADLRNGVGPTAIVAFDEDGAEIGRQPTGIG